MLAIVLKISSQVEMNVLEVHNLSKAYRYGSNFFKAVDHIDLTLSPGEILAFLGPNGAGKTTAIKMIAGLIQPDTGWVSILGKNPHHTSQARSHLGAVLEGNRNLYWRLTPQENLEYFGVLRGVKPLVVRQRIPQLLEHFNLMHKRHTPVETLSRGMQQKLAIAVALIHNPQLLLLDEPTLGLDVEATQDVKTLVRETANEGRSILLTTHQLDIAEELSDRVAIIKQGEIITQELTRNLLRRFSGAAYAIEVDGELNSEQVRAINALNTVVQENATFYVQGTEALYELLAILKPLPILNVKKEQGTLTEIFLNLIQHQDDT